jgi:hypothetical protein
LIRIRLVASLLFAAFLSRTAPLTMVVLNSQASQGGRLPEGWQVKVNRGTPDISVINAPERTSVRLKCRKASFGLERGVDIEPAQFPYLSWSWKVAELPRHGDFRRAVTDDQAAQVLVAFADRRILTYIWDSNAPRGTMQSASSIPLVHIHAIVCRSGSAELNQWVSETRNVAQDYEKAYGRRSPRVKGIRLQINTQHTGSSAESEFGEVTFHSTPQ